MGIASWFKDFFAQPPFSAVTAKKYVDARMGYVPQLKDDSWGTLNLFKHYNRPNIGDCDDFARAYHDSLVDSVDVWDSKFYLFYAESLALLSGDIPHVVLVINEKWVMDCMRKEIYKLKEIKNRSPVPYWAIPEEAQSHCLSYPDLFR